MSVRKTLRRVKRDTIGTDGSSHRSFRGTNVGAMLQRSQYASGADPVPSLQRRSRVTVEKFLGPLESASTIVYNTLTVPISTTIDF